MKAKREKARGFVNSQRYIANIEILYRMEVFLAALSFALAAIYAVGTWQSFMDSTLAMILNLISISALADVFLSFIVIIKEVFSALCKRRKPRLLVIVSSLLFLILSLFFLFVSHALTAVSQGFRA